MPESLSKADSDVPTIYYLTDAEGTKTHVVLSIEDYDEIVDQLQDQQELVEIKARRDNAETSLSLEEVKQTLKL